jgi:hemoglobin
MEGDVTVYEQAGGMAFFEALADRFYEGVVGDLVLLRLYPDPGNLVPARRRLALFLAQYWGGPTTYSAERGHPRLRQRHYPYQIGPLERDHWVACMRAALAATHAPRDVEERLEAYFDVAAEAMRNKD